MVKEMVAIHRVFIIHDDTVHGEGDGSTYIVSSLFTTILYMVKEMVAIHRVFIIHDDTVHGEGDGSHTPCLHYSRRYCTW